MFSSRYMSTFPSINSPLGSKSIDCPCLALVLVWNFDMQLLPML